MDRRNFSFGLMGGTLIGQSYSPGVTRLKRLFNARRGESGNEPRTGPMRSAPIPFRLVANAPAVVIAAQDPFRKGLLIQNLDATGDLFLGFGILADANGFRLPAGGVVLLDFICPTDTISVFSTVDCSGILIAFAPISE